MILKISKSIFIESAEPKLPLVRERFFGGIAPKVWYDYYLQCNSIRSSDSITSFKKNLKAYLSFNSVKSGTLLLKQAPSVKSGNLLTRHLFPATRH